MTKEPDFDVAAAHKYFSVECFNRAWKLLDQSERSAEEDEEMIRLSLASHWHWTQREDCTAANVSTAYWQTSRIYAVLGQAENARRYAHGCLDASQGEEVAPFYLGYAYEALARAEMVAGNAEKKEQHLREAERIAETLPNPDAKNWLMEDLQTIR